MNESNKTDAMKQALHKSIELIGGQTKVASEMQVTPAAVHSWLLYGRVPIKRARTLSALTEDLVTIEELRPDIFCS